jgi:hypothetical protein
MNERCTGRARPEILLAAALLALAAGAAALVVAILELHRVVG